MSTDTATLKRCDQCQHWRGEVYGKTDSLTGEPCDFGRCAAPLPIAHSEPLDWDDLPTIAGNTGGCPCWEAEPVELVDDQPLLPIPERCPKGVSGCDENGKVWYSACNGRIIPRDGFHKCESCGVSYGPVEGTGG